jgi:SHS family lactate transporter-like MFS transporter
LGWSLDAFDFFLLVFVLKDIAVEFHSDISNVTLAILLTLAMRAIGAFIFGCAADRWGRRPTLMVDILLYSTLEFASGFAPSLTVLIILCALYDVAMGGERGVGASLTMETIPRHARGFVSGLLRSGDPTGYFVASIVYGGLFPYIGWRGMLMVDVIPALLVLYIRRNVPESPSWSKEASRKRGEGELALGDLRGRADDCLQFLQSRYPGSLSDLLQIQHKLSPHAVGIIAVIYNIGAICGGTLSERFGRRRCMIIAALLSLPVIPLWAFSDESRSARCRRIPDAIHRTGRLGRCAGAPQRTISRHRERHISRCHLSARHLLASINAILQAGIATHFGGAGGRPRNRRFNYRAAGRTRNRSKGVFLEGRGQGAIITMRHISTADFERQI